MKAFLIDQSYVAGIGNAYADEILFDAKLNPFRISSVLSDQEVAALHESIVNILQYATNLAIETFTFDDTLNSLEPKIRGWFKVHATSNAVCPICGEFITRNLHCGKNTYFCPTCQE